MFVLNDLGAVFQDERSTRDKYDAGAPGMLPFFFFKYLLSKTYAAKTIQWVDYALFGIWRDTWTHVRFLYWDSHLRQKFLFKIYIFGIATQTVHLPVDSNLTILILIFHENQPLLDKADVLNQFRKAIYYDEVVKESNGTSGNLCKYFWEFVLSMQMLYN